MALSKKIFFFVLTYSLLFLAGYLFAQFFIEGDYTPPTKTVITEATSPDGMFKAFVLKDASDTYHFAIAKKDGTRLIVDEDLFSGRGYHQPIFTLSWNKTSDLVSVEVDHDFGDNNLLYRFDTHKMSWEF
jgi:hypothetical protein